MSSRASFRAMALGCLAAFAVAMSLYSISCRLAGFSHESHLENGVECTSCHGEEGAEPQQASGARCSECHDEASKYRDVKTTWRKPDRYGDVVFSHSLHRDAGVECSTCHEPSLPSGELMSLPVMKNCTGCHRKEGVDVECATCHLEVRKGKRPRFHEGTFAVEHDRWSREGRGYCEYCHGRDGCETCHSRMKPSSHRGAWAQSVHGVAAAQDREKCAVCHEAGFCTRCHSQPPPSHGIPNFKYGGHELPARKNSRACLTCHSRSFCAKCH